MTIPPEKQKPKNTSRPFVREQIIGADKGCLRGLIVFMGLLMMFSLLLFVMSRL